jgi:hypothetical protein
VTDREDGSSTVTDRQAKERLADWRAAERAEAKTEEGSHARRRAHSTSRRARWAFEDAARQAGHDHGAVPETLGDTMRRGLTRLREASDGAADIVGNRERAHAPAETAQQRDERLAEEEEFTRELGE